MWLATKFGFYSIVQKNGVYNVRARAKKDLVNLCNTTTFLKGRKIHYFEMADYPFRIFCNKRELDVIMIVLSNEIDYSNFKDTIKKGIRNQRDKEPFYTQIWIKMFNYGSEFLTKNGWHNYFDQRYGSEQVEKIE